MHPIFFTWKGDYASLCATGIFYHASGSRTVAIAHESAYIGVIHSHPKVRSHAKALHANLTILPGPHGTLEKRHVDALNAVLPPANRVAVGDSMSPTLRYVHSLYGDEEFHPNNY